MQRRAIRTDSAPKAIGPYSQAIRCGDWVFTAGQVALDPETGQLVNGDVGSQTVQALRNLQAVLEAAGSSMRSVLRTTVYMVDLEQFVLMNAAYAQFFGSEDAPARSTVGVAGLPLGAQVEIDAIARVDHPATGAAA
jgi:2-iminobutanoate/2-iminopropanoate deaminase